MAWTTLTLNSDGSQKRSNILAVGGMSCKIFCCVFVVFLDDRRPFVKRFALCCQTVVCLSCLSVTLVYYGQTVAVGWMDQDETWHAGRHRPLQHCVRWGPSSPSPKSGRSFPLIFSPYLLWPNGWMNQAATW